MGRTMSAFDEKSTVEKALKVNCQKQVASVETLSSTKLQTKVERKVELIENENRFQFYVLKIPIKFSNVFVKNIEQNYRLNENPPFQNTEFT